MQATRSTSTKARQARETDPPTMRGHSPFVMSGTLPGPAGGRRRATSSAFARWLRRAAADSARAWALTAGVHPDLYQ